MSFGLPEAVSYISGTSAGTAFATEHFERAWAILHSATAVVVPVMCVADDDGGGGSWRGGGIDAVGHLARPQSRPSAESGTGTAGCVLSVVDWTLYKLMCWLPGKAELARCAKQRQRRGASAKRSRKDGSRGGAARCGGTAAGAAPGAVDYRLQLDDQWSPIINISIDSSDRRYTSEGQGRLPVKLVALCSSDDDERHGLNLRKLTADVSMGAMVNKVLRGLQMIEEARREHS